MGKIQKLRQLRKLEVRQKEEQKIQGRKKILKWVIICLLGLTLIVYGAILFFGNKNKMAENTPAPSASPSQNTFNESLFPFFSPTVSPNLNMDKAVKNAVIKTDKGVIKLELYPEAAPKTVANFADLINKGFYNGLKFHRVISDFMIQGGDPKGDGTGGPGYAFEDEINPWSLGLSEDAIKALEIEGYKYTHNLISHKVIAGALAMANAGPNTNGSQFFIVTEQNQPHLDGRHTVFGRVIEGMDVVHKIQQGDIIKEIKIVN